MPQRYEDSGSDRDVLHILNIVNFFQPEIHSRTIATNLWFSYFSTVKTVVSNCCALIFIVISTVYFVSHLGFVGHITSHFLV